MIATVMIHCDECLGKFATQYFVERRRIQPGKDAIFPKFQHARAFQLFVENKAA